MSNGEDNEEASGRGALRTPPPLPVTRGPQGWRLARVAVLGVAQALALLGLSWLMDGLEIDGVATAIAVVSSVMTPNGRPAPSNGLPAPSLR